eukprot:COSAG06_NODE_49167_length_327_cov_0.855263_1_plen_23_part_01
MFGWNVDITQTRSGYDSEHLGNV